MQADKGYDENMKFEGSDAAWVDETMDSRRKEEIDPKITQLFRVPKRKSVALSAAEVDSISWRNKKLRSESYVLPKRDDTLLEKGSTEEKKHVTANNSQTSDLTTCVNNEDRRRYSLSDKVSGLNVVDQAEGHSLKSSKITTSTEEEKQVTASDGAENTEEAQKAKLLLLSVIETDTEVSPACLELRSALINHALEKDPKRFLEEAVDHCPLHVELWIGLARLEKLYDAAKEVLKKAREKLPRERALWIEEAKLEESANGGNTKHMVEELIIKGIRALFEQHVEFDRVGWMKDAEAAEKSGCLETCKAIIMNTVGIGVKKEERKVTWFADAEDCKNRGSFETARAIYMYALGSFGSSKKSIWLKAIQFEKAHGTRETVDELLCVAVRIPKGEVFWLMLANEKMITGDVSEAREVLKVAYSKLPESEEIWHAAFKLEYENNKLERARKFLKKARSENKGGGRPERMWMKSAIVERELGDVAGERRLLDEGLEFFPWFFKLWLMLGQLEERLDLLPKAKDAYKSGVKHCPTSTPLWLSLAKVEERMSGSGFSSEVVDVLKMARKRNPKDPQLWLAAVRAEKSELVAVRLMEKALKECRGSKNSGILLAYSIEMSSTSEEWKTFVSNTKCEEEEEVKDPHVIAAIGNKKLFSDSDDGNKKVDEARTWLNRAVTVAPDVGDFWAFLYKFELIHGSEDEQEEVLSKCIAAQPKHGDRWQPISKAVENSHQPVEVILNKLVLALDKEEEDEQKAAAAAHHHHHHNNNNRGHYHFGKKMKAAATLDTPGFI